MANYPEPGRPTAHRYALSEKCTGPIRSLSSRISTPIEFLNSTHVSISVHWIDFNCQERPYGVVPPGKKMWISTFVTHPWCFRSQDPARLPTAYLCVDGKPVAFPSVSRKDFTVSVAPSVPWTLANHCRDFRAHAPQFCAAVRALLLSHNRLRDGGGSSGGGNGGAGEQRRAHQTAPVQEDDAPRWLLRLLLPGTRRSVEQHIDPKLGRALVLGDLPMDVVLEIVSRMAPAAVPLLLVVRREDMELPAVVASPVMSMLQLAQQVLGPEYILDHPHTREFTFGVRRTMAPAVAAPPAPPQHAAAQGLVQQAALQAVPQAVAQAVPQQQQQQQQQQQVVAGAGQGNGVMLPPRSITERALRKVTKWVESFTQSP